MPTPVPIRVRRPGAYLDLLQRLLALRSTELRPTLSAACTLIAEIFHADKVDCFLVDESDQTLVALGVSATPLGARQRELGLDVLPVARGGRAAWVFLRGVSFITGHSEDDPEELEAVKRELGVRSSAMVPLLSDTRRRGVLSVTSQDPERYSRDDLRFLEAIAQWMNMLLHRLDLLSLLEADQPPPLPSAEETIAHLTQECLRLRGELLYWQNTADTLLMELHRWQLLPPGAPWEPDRAASEDA
ncbi:MAG TPA: GAF domain-containing protein [Herpetosiphonaceae bacterium]|nr:GAF domain-containing protein [Herpetosiphonaceae bacterium]